MGGGGDGEEGGGGDGPCGDDEGEGGATEDRTGTRRAKRVVMETPDTLGKEVWLRWITREL